MFKKWKELPKNALACSFGHLSFGQLSVGNYSGDHFERNPENFAISKKKHLRYLWCNQRVYATQILGKAKYMYF